MVKITVEPHEQAVATRLGAVLGVLGPGRHRLRWRTHVVRVDGRERLTTVAGQELLTSDGVTVKVSASLRWRVVDALSWFGVATEPESLVYLAVQVALREQLTGLTADELVRTGRDRVAEPALAAASAAGSPVGVEVLAVVVKDVVLPPEVRYAYAELLAARQRGQATLETARAETAALRSMANGARLLDDHPALARLRLVQAAPPGAKIVLSLDGPAPVGGD